MAYARLDQKISAERSDSKEQQRWELITQPSKAAVVAALTLMLGILAMFDAGIDMRDSVATWCILTATACETGLLAFFLMKDGS